MRIALLTIVCGTALAASAGHASGGIITIQPATDRDGTDFPRGGAFEFLGDETDVSLDVSNQTNVTPIAERRAAMEFDLGALPSSVSILSATLTLTISGTNGLSPPTFRVYGYSGDGVIELGDMLETSTLLSGSLSSAGLGKRTIDVSNFIENLLQIDAAYVGILVAADLDTANTLNSFLIGSSNQPNVLNRPTLNIEYEAASVPEPSSLALLGLGAIGAGIGRIHRRRANAQRRPVA